MRIRNVLWSLNVINTQFQKETGQASRHHLISRSAGRSWLLDLEKSVKAAGLCGVVQNALSSPELGGPRRESTQRDGNKSIELGKGDLIRHISTNKESSAMLSALPQQTSQNSTYMGLIVTHIVGGGLGRSYCHEM